MVQGELRGDTRVHVADGARLSAGDDIRLTGFSDNDLQIKAQVVNLVSLTGLPIANFSLAYARGDVDTDTDVTIDHGAWLGEDGAAIGGLDLRAETRNDVRVTAKAYSFASSGLSGAVALQFTDTDTRAALHADVTAADDVNVAARSITEYNSTFTDASAGLNLLALSQIFSEEVAQYIGETRDVVYASSPHETFEGDIASVSSFSPLEKIGMGTGAAAGAFLTALGTGLGFAATIADIDNRVSAVIGPESDTDTVAPVIDAGGNVSVHAGRVMQDVHVAGGSAVMDGLNLLDPSDLMAPQNAVAIGVAYTDIVNDADALVGPGTVIDANRIGVNAVSDISFDTSFREPIEDFGDFMDKYFNVCGGICSNVTSYTATLASADGVGLSGNVNWWEVDNKAAATVGEGATITARGASDADNGWESVLPEGPLPGPDGLGIERVALSWRDEIDVRSYARVEEVHVAGLFKLFGTFLGTLLGNGANPLGGSLNRIQHDNGASATVADDVRMEALTAGGGYGDVGVRARTDEFIVAVNPSAGAGNGGSVAGNITAGLIDVDGTTSATVSSSARLTGNDVTVAADYQIGGWVVSGGLLSNTSTVSVGISIAGLDVDANVTARIGDPGEVEDDGNDDNDDGVDGLTDDDIDVPLDRPEEAAAHTVRANDLTVRSRSYGNVGAVGIQVKVPGINANMDPDTAVKTDKTTQRMQTASKSLKFMGPLAPLATFVSSPSTIKGRTGQPSFSGSLTGATGFSTIDVNTDAELGNVRIGGHDGGAIDAVRVIARREIDHMSISGSAGLSAYNPAISSTFNVNVAATVALDISGGNTEALVEGARIAPVADLDVIASRGDGGVVAGLGASTKFGPSFGLEATLSVSLQLDETTTRAAVRDSAVTTTAGNDMEVLAFDTTRATVGSGAGTFGTSGAGVGLTMGFSLGERTIEAEVADSDLTVGGDLDVRARRLTQTVAVGAAVGGGKGVLQLSGSAASIVAVDTVTASIADSTVAVDGDVDVATTLDTGDLGFRYADAGLEGREARTSIPGDPEGFFDLSGIEYLAPAEDAIPDGSGAYDLSIAGGLSATSGNGASAAAAFNDIENNVTARISRTTISGSADAINVRAVDETRTSAIAIVGNVASGVSAAVTVAGNHVDNTLVAEIVDGTTVEQDVADPVSWEGRDVDVRVEDRTDVRALALSASVSGSSGAGAALSINKVDTSRTARISGSMIEAADVTVRALACGIVRGRAYGLAGSGGGLGGAGSAPINLLGDTVTATIGGGAHVEARDSVVVEAAAEQRSQVLAGAAGVASGAGVAGTVPVNRLDTDVSAYIGLAEESVDGVLLGPRTTVIAHGLGDDDHPSMRTGELVNGPELSDFEAVKLATDDDGNESIEGLDDPGPDELVAETGEIRGVGVGAFSLQSSASVGGTLGGGGGLGLGLAITLDSVDGETDSGIRHANVTAGSVASHAPSGPSVDVLAASQAWTADIAVVGAASGGGAVGAGLTLAGVSRSTRAEVVDADIAARGMLDVDARTRIGTSLLTIGVGVSGGAAAAAQAGMVVHASETEAIVHDTSVDTAGLDIASDADNGALLTVGSGGFGLGVGAGIGGGILFSTMETTAALKGGDADTIDVNGGDVSVTALTESDLRNAVAGIAGGAAAGVAGSVTYSQFHNQTNALVEGSDGGSLQLGMQDAPIDKLTVRADETVDLEARAGSLGVGVTGAGFGGAAAMVLGRSTVDATVRAVDVEARAIDIDADRDLKIRTRSASGAGGLVGALAGGVSLVALGDTGLGELDEELDADEDGSVSLVGALSPDRDTLSGALGAGGDNDAAEGEAGDEDDLITEDRKDGIAGLFDVDPLLGDGGGTDRARVRIEGADLYARDAIDVDATTRIGTRARAGAGAVGAGAGAGIGVARTALAGENRVEVVGGSRLSTGEFGFVSLSAAARDRTDYGAIDISVASGAAAGILSFGGSWVHGENSQTSVIDIDDSHVETGHARIVAGTDQSAEAEAYAGAVAAVTGFATRVELDLAPTARVDIDGGIDLDGNGDIDPWEVGGLDIDARNDLVWDHQALGTGIGGASFGGAQAGVDLAATSDVEFDGGFAVTLPRKYRAVGAGIGVHAHNVLAPSGENDRVAISYAGGVIAGAFPSSETTVDLSADVAIGDDVVLDGRGGDPDGRGGDLVIGAANELAITDHVRSVAGGVLFAASAGDLRADVTGTDEEPGRIEQSVSIGAGTRLMAARDLSVSTAAGLDIDTGVNASGGGTLGAKAVAHGTTELDIDHHVEVDRTAELGALRDVVLDAGAASASEVALETRAYTRGLGGKAIAGATVDLDYDMALDIGVGNGAAGWLRAGRDVRMVADAGAVDAAADWDTTSSAVFAAIRDSGGSPDTSTVEDFRLAMPVEAGYLNDIRINILDDDAAPTPEGYRFTVTDGDGNNILDELLAWTRIELEDGFNPYQSVKERRDDAASDSNTSAILDGVLGSLPDEAVATVEIGDLAASAGNIVIDAGSHDDGVFSRVRFDSGASLTASGDPAIDIVNDSSRFLRLLGDTRLRGGEGGAVTVAGQSLGDDVTAGDLPDTVAVARETASGDDLTVNVTNTLDPVTGPAPGLFIEGAIANPAGTVRLHNAAGDLVQYDEVIATTIDIDVPEGTFTVSNPGGYWPGNKALLRAALYRTELGLDELDADAVDDLIKNTYYSDIERLCCDITDIRTNTINSDSPGDNGFVSYTGSDTIATTEGSLLRARRVGIDAKYIDLDTDIEAGRASELSVDLGADVLDQILDSEDGAGYVTLDVGDQAIGARYNRATRRIEVERLTGSGPGAVYLNGRIYSSVRDADITVNRGAADIDITNNTGIPIELVDIDAGAPGAAVVKITDHFKRSDGAPQTTWYVDGTAFEQDLDQRETRRYVTHATYAHWSDAVAALRDGDPDTGPERRTEGADVYSPKSGVGFRIKSVWQADGTGAYADESDGIRRQQDNFPDPILTWERRFETDVDWISAFDDEDPEITVGDYSDELGSDGQYERHRQTQIRGFAFSDIFNCGGVMDRCDWRYGGSIDWAKLKQFEYIRADSDVGIGFAGGAGGIDVESNAAVYLAGSVDNPAGRTSVRAIADDTTNPSGWTAADGVDPTVGIFSAANAARIDGRSIKLEATDSIGVAGDGGAVRLGGRAAVDAVSHQGSVYLTGPAQADGALRLERVHADQGRAVVRHDAGALINATVGSDAVIRAGLIELDAEEVGTTADPLRIELTDTELRGGAADSRVANAVNARGVEGAHLEAVAGDLLVGEIETTSAADGAGDVSLVASGDGAAIRAASNRETDFQKVVDDSEDVWKALGLIDDGDTDNAVGIDAQRDRDVESFEARVEHGYREDWRIRNLAVNADDEVEIEAGSTAYEYFVSLSGADDVAAVEAWIAERRQAIDALFDEAFEDGQAPALPDDYAGAAAFTYDASKHDAGDGISVAQARRARYEAWTLEELATPLPADAAQGATANVLDNTPVHIAATGDVTLEADGDIGRVLPDTAFTVENEWKLPDDDARAALLGAGAGDITCTVGGIDPEACATDSTTGTFDFAEDTTYTFTIERRQALRVDAQGTLDATSRGNVLLGDGDVDDGLTVGTIEAAGELRLLSTAPVTAASDGGLLLDAAEGLWMTSATGAIGSQDDPITVSVDGAVQDAIGTGGVYLEAAETAGHGGTLTLRRVAASHDGTIGLSGGGEGHRIEGGGGINLAGKTVTVDFDEYTGSVGADTRLTVADDTTVTGVLHGSGHLAGDDTASGEGAFAFGDFTVAGDLTVTGNAAIDVVGDLDIDAQGRLDGSAIDIASAGGIEARDLILAASKISQAAGTTIAVDDHAHLLALERMEFDGGLTAGSLTAENRLSGGTSFSQADTGDIAVAGAARFDFTGDLDLAGEVETDTLDVGIGGATTIADLSATTITDLDAGGAVELAGDGDVAYGRIRSRGGSLTVSGFDALRGDGRLSPDGGAGRMEAAGRLAVSGFDVLGAAAGFDGETRLQSEADIDLRAADVVDPDAAGIVAEVRVDELIADGSITVDAAGDVSASDITGGETLTVTGAAIDVSAADTAGTQTYTGDTLTYGELVAGTWSGASRGEGEIKRESDIDADISGDIAGAGADNHARATGSVSFLGDTVDVDAVTATDVVLDGTTIDASVLNAGTDIALSAVTEATVFELEAGGDLGLEAGERWIFQTLRTGGDVAARAGEDIEGGVARVGGTAFFRSGFEDPATVARAPGDGGSGGGGLAIDQLTADRARLHTTGVLDVADPRLTNGLEVRADTLSMTAIDTDGGGFDADTANASGGAMKRLDLAVTGADHVTFDRLYTASGHLATDTPRIDIDRAWVTGELDVATPTIDLLVKNDDPVLQDGYDTQLYGPGGRFWLRQNGAVTRTSALILRAPRGWGMETAKTLIGSELTELHAVFDGTAPLLDPAAWSNGHRGNDPHPDGRPALKMTFECTLPFSLGNVGGFPGLWSANDRDCGASASSRDPGRQI